MTGGAPVFALFRGTPYGGWEYQLVPDTDATSGLGVGLGLAVIVAALGWATVLLADRRPRLLLVVWYLVGSAVQLTCWVGYPYSCADLLRSPMANSFWTTTQDHSFREFVTRFHDLAPTLTIHARANLPGKTLVTYALEAVTSDTHQLALVLIALANLGAGVGAAVSWELFEDRLTMVATFAACLLIPARVHFLPLMNSLTPTLILFPFWLWLRYLRRPQPGWLVALGTSLYVLFIFEPLPMVTGLIFTAFLIRAAARGHLRPSQVVTVFVLVPGFFFLAAGLAWLTVGFDTWRAVAFAWEDAREFNALQQRPYAIWVICNLGDFFFHAGVPTALVFLAYVLWGLTQLLVRPARSVGLLKDNLSLLALSTFATILTLDLMGVNRGETVRLWIFLAVFLHLIVVRLATLWQPYWTVPGLLAIETLQAALSQHQVIWIGPP